jgi:hypothetical protein
VREANDFEARVAQLETSWRERLEPVRANSAVDLILRLLPGAPILTVDGAATLIGRTFNPANEAIQRLVAAEILRQVNVGRRNRAYEAPDVIAAFTALERQLASPEGDTRMSKPVRRVPERRSSSIGTASDE